MSSAMRRIDDGRCITLTVAATKTATEGYGAVFITDDQSCDEAGANTGLCIGVFLADGVAGDRVTVACDGIVPVKLSDTATRGTLAQVTATGFENAPAANAAGATTTYTYGTFMQSGVSGDMVGLKWEKGSLITA